MSIKSNQSREVINRATNNKTKGGPKMKMSEAEKEAKRTELNQMSDRIRSQYQEVAKLEKDVNRNIYEIGSSLRDILDRKLFKLLMGADEKPLTFKGYCEQELKFSNKYAYMLINTATIQDVLEQEKLTEVKQGHHPLRKLYKYINDRDLLKKIWQKASHEDLKYIPNVADIGNAIDEIVPAPTVSADPVEAAYRNVLKWGGLKKLTSEQRRQLIERLTAFINDNIETEDDVEDND